jgi:hypothetical protein
MWLMRIEIQVRIPKIVTRLTKYWKVRKALRRMDMYADVQQILERASA